MNSLIKQIFRNFSVNGVKIPVSFLRYNGTSTTYITYQELNAGDTFYGDNELMNYISYYDFDIYSKGDFFPIMKSVKKLLKDNGFRWEPTLSSADMFEDDTGYYHKTLCFSIIRNVEDTDVASV